MKTRNQVKNLAVIRDIWLNFDRQVKDSLLATILKNIEESVNSFPDISCLTSFPAD